ncbi:MAG: hypothetical protein WDZ40_01740 [Candidatus Spechtbacterales bacterium]
MEQLFSTIEVIANPIAVLMIALGAFYFVIGGANEAYRKKGKGLVVYAVVGYLLATVAFPMLYNIVSSLMLASLA